MSLEGSKALVRDGWIAVRDADRCVSMHVTPATGELHRQLRDVLNNSNALIAEIERLQLALDEGKRHRRVAGEGRGLSAYAPPEPRIRRT